MIVRLPFKFRSRVVPLLFKLFPTFLSEGRRPAWQPHRDPPALLMQPSVTRALARAHTQPGVVSSDACPARPPPPPPLQATWGIWTS